MPQLLIQNGSAPTTSHEIVGDLVTIGRAAENTIVLEHESTSGRHAEIERKDGKYFLRDLGSSNGTKLNGVFVQQAEIKDGDMICFCPVEAVFSCPVEPKAAEVLAARGQTPPVATDKLAPSLSMAARIVLWGMDQWKNPSERGKALTLLSFLWKKILLGCGTAKQRGAVLLNSTRRRVTAASVVIVAATVFFALKAPWVKVDSTGNTPTDSSPGGWRQPTEKGEDAAKSRNSTSHEMPQGVVRIATPSRIGSARSQSQPSLEGMWEVHMTNDLGGWRYLPILEIWSIDAEGVVTVMSEYDGPPGRGSPTKRADIGPGKLEKQGSQEYALTYDMFTDNTHSVLYKSKRYEITIMPDHLVIASTVIEPGKPAENWPDLKAAKMR